MVIETNFFNVIKCIISIYFKVSNIVDANRQRTEIGSKGNMYCL